MKFNKSILALLALVVGFGFTSKATAISPACVKAKQYAYNYLVSAENALNIAYTGMINQGNTSGIEQCRLAVYYKDAGDVQFTHLNGYTTIGLYATSGKYMVNAYNTTSDGSIQSYLSAAYNNLASSNSWIGYLRAYCGWK